MDEQVALCQNPAVGAAHDVSEAHTHTHTHTQRRVHSILLR